MFINRQDIQHSMKGNLTKVVVLIATGILFNFVCCAEIYSYYTQSAYGSALPPKLFSGQIHFARIPVQYWQHRILTIKAMGLNALSVYVMWNHHQLEKGKFDYSTQNKNLNLFLNIAQKHGMYVLLRPGPYVCAQWDFGGLPARLYSIPNLKVRSNNKQFLDEVKIYFASLAPIIKKHIRNSENPTGSIVLLQIQNQYGSYGSDLNYIASIRQIWADLSVVCQQYHEDGSYYLVKSHWAGANIGLSGGTTDNDYDYARSVERKGIIFGGQIYTGWLTHWGQKWAKVTTEANIKQFGFLLTRNISFSMYMIHGGTNFALTAGANQKTGKSDYTPHVTSYDYDSPINQQGGTTPKYQALKQLLSKYVDWEVPNKPNPIPTIQIPRFTVNPVGSMLQHLGAPSVKDSINYYHFQSQQLKMFNQGFVVYETTLTKRVYYFKGVFRDFAHIVLDNKYVTQLDRSESTEHNFTVNCTIQSCNFKIIVEAMGHVNYDHLMDSDIKGMFNISDDLDIKFKWNIYKVPIDQNIFSWNIYQKQLKLPTLLKAELTLQNVGDTYLETSQLKKGYLFVNGRNLGRYWNKGPQNRLYCPGVWLKQGVNTIYVLELLYDGKQNGIAGRKTLE